MKNTTGLLIILIFAITFAASCSDSRERGSLTRNPSDIDPPSFTSLEWPETCSVLTDGKLIITGTLYCPGDPDQETPIALFVFSDPCGSCGEESIGESGGKSELNADDIPYVKELVDKVTAYLRNKRQGQSNKENEFPEGCQAYYLWTFESNEYEYFQSENGRFRLDFDQWCRFNPDDDIILIIVGIDSYGQTIEATNIYRVPPYEGPEVTAATLQVRQEYGEMMTEFGQAMLDVLSYYPEDHYVDISAIQAMRDLYEDAYMGGHMMGGYKDLGIEFGLQMDDLAQEIEDEDFREVFIAATDYIEEQFLITGKLAKGAHFQRLFAESDPVQNFWDSVDKLDAYYNTYPVTVERISLPNNGLRVIIDIYDSIDEETLAHIIMEGTVSNPLSVTGYIREHTITSNDYSPYFLEIFGLLCGDPGGYAPVIAH